MKPLPLFDGHDDAGEQAENIERVNARVESAIKEFCRTHEVFHADDLRRYVVRETGIAAPGSADRILRLLRQRGQLDYKCISRSQSLYRVFSVGGVAVGTTTKEGAC